MVQGLNIAVVGAGPTGLATASFLKKAGFNPTVFERFEQPQPLGSGLMIQPTGLSCLRDLGLEDQAIHRSAVIEGIFGDTDQERVIFDLGYRALGEETFALGMHRAVLFDLLFEKARALSVAIKTSHRIVDYREIENQIWLLREDAIEVGPFDLVIDASGTGSKLRQMHGEIKRDNLYTYGALWGVCEVAVDDLDQNYLIQRYVDARIMIGLLPLGSALSSTGRGQMAFFWSLKHENYSQWLEQPFVDWQQEAVSIWPKAKDYVAQFSNHEDLTLATYNDTLLKSYSRGRLVFVGDAAHATSPQLGQGANMGLMDARQLAKSLATANSLEEALRHHQKVRQPQVLFYQRMSHWLTPFFQSDGKALARFRDLTFAPSAKIPYVRQQMMKTLAGVKTGLFSELNQI